MRLTIDIRDDQAHQLGLEQRDFEQLVHRIISQISKYTFIEEITEFLSRRPQRQEIIDFHASEKSQARIRELLAKNRAGTLTSEDQAKLNAVESLNHIFALLKASARQQAAAHA
jgi:histidyl-tRNA synthetase